MVSMVIQIIQTGYSSAIVSAFCFSKAVLSAPNDVGGFGSRHIHSLFHERRLLLVGMVVDGCDYKTRKSLKASNQPGF